jgi:hypothetical protein
MVTRTRQCYVTQHCRNAFPMWYKPNLLNIIQFSPRLRLQPRKPWFDPRPLLVRFVVDAVALGEVFLWTYRVFSVTIYQPILATHLCLPVPFAERQMGEFWES